MFSCLESSECKADALEGKLAEPCVGFVPIPAGHLCTDLSTSLPLYLCTSVPLYPSVQLLNPLVMGVSPSLVVASLGLQILEFIWEFSYSLCTMSINNNNNPSYNILCAPCPCTGCQQLLTCGHRSPLPSSHIIEVPLFLESLGIHLRVPEFSLHQCSGWPVVSDHISLKSSYSWT